MQCRTAVFLVMALLGLATLAARAESPIAITDFRPSGELTWTNSDPSIVSFHLEWVSSLHNPWTNDWSAFLSIPNTRTNYSVALPSFYRVVGDQRRAATDASDSGPIPTSDVEATPKELRNDLSEEQAPAVVSGDGKCKTSERSR